MFPLQESADERWRPILGVEQILMSVISLFSDPNDTSPANIDAAVRPVALLVLAMQAVASVRSQRVGGGVADGFFF